jgi:hypothetical protein
MQTNAFSKIYSEETAFFRIKLYNIFKDWRTFTKGLEITPRFLTVYNVEINWPFCYNLNELSPLLHILCIIKQSFTSSTWWSFNKYAIIRSSFWMIKNYFFQILASHFGLSFFRFNISFNDDITYDISVYNV